MKKLILTLLLVPTIAFAGVVFDGIDDYVTMGAPVDLQFATGQPFSFSLWAKPSNDAAAGQVQIFGYTQGTTDGWLLVQDNAVGTKNVEFCDYDGFDYVCKRTPNSSFTNGNWYHIVATDTGAETCEARQLYLNTTRALTERTGGSGCTGVVNINYSGNSVKIGVRDTTSYWAGEVTDLRVYNYALSSAQVELLYFARLKYPFDVGATPLSCWTLDEVSDGLSSDGKIFRDKCGSTLGTGVDGANNTGLLGIAESFLMYLWGLF